MNRDETYGLPGKKKLGEFPALKYPHSTLKLEIEAQRELHEARVGEQTRRHVEAHGVRK